jgi:hypothetical protein
MELQYTAASSYSITVYPTRGFTAYRNTTAIGAEVVSEISRKCGKSAIARD